MSDSEAFFLLTVAMSVNLDCPSGRCQISLQNSLIMSFRELRSKPAVIESACASLPDSCVPASAL